MAFKTEKEVEQRLEYLERQLSTKDGAKHNFRMMRIHWDSGDFVNKRHWRWNYMVESAIKLSENYNIDKNTALAYIVTHWHNWLEKKVIKSKTPIDIGISPLLKKPWSPEDKHDSAS